MKSFLLILSLVWAVQAVGQDNANQPPPAEETALEAAPPPAQEPGAEPAPEPTPEAAPEKGESKDDGKSAAKDKEAESKADMAAATGINLSELIKPIVYDQNERPRDPFRLPEVPLEPLSPGPVFGPFSQMQEISLDQIEVKGIILHPTSSKAIISYKPPGSDKDKTVVVHVGDPLGENFGRIQAIRDGKVIILQTLEENGALRTTTHVLSIRRYNLKQ